MIVAIFDIASSLAGCYSVFLWWKTSKLATVPTWNFNTSPEKSDADHNDAVFKNMMGWITGVMNNFRASSEINRKAATWTGFSVLLNTISVTFRFL